MYLSTSQQELFSGLVFGAKKKKKEYDSMTDALVHICKVTHMQSSILHRSNRSNALKTKSCQCQQIILVLLPTIQVTSVCVVYSYQASLRSGKCLPLSKNRPKAYTFGTSALLFALRYLHILYFRPILNII